jgi:PAS domain S-box-containing protein
MTADFKVIKNYYIERKVENATRILDEKTISGYLVVKDIYNAPVAIIRTDIERDIAAQGKSSMNLLIILLAIAGTIIAFADNLLLSGVVLKKIVNIAYDVENLGKNGVNNRLKLGLAADEVDKLRLEINKMLDSLEVEKQKGESLIDLVNALVVMLDKEGNVVLINQKGLDLLGFKREEVIGKNWLKEFISNRLTNEVTGKFNQLIAGKVEENAESENEVMTKDKKILFIAWHNTVLRDVNGNITATLSLGDDITVKKQEEKRKEQYSRELERLNEVMVDREIKMIALKKELAKLSQKS